MKSIFGKCEIIKDSKGNEYLAIDVPIESCSQYTNFVINKGLIEEVANKNKRDLDKYHITLINVAQWGSLCKRLMTSSIINEFVGKEFEFFSYGIGHATKDENNSYFIILENKELQLLRDSLSIGKQDFHITLGFKNKDVFGVPKDITSLVFSLEEIFSFQEKEFTSSLKRKK
jgi:hypothetical protein